MSKPKTIDALMDGISATSKASGAMGAILYGLDISINADISNDRDLILTDAEAKKLLALLDPKSEAYKVCQKMIVHLKTAMEKDFSDHTKEQLKAQILPYRDTIDSQTELMKGLIGKMQEG